MKVNDGSAVPLVTRLAKQDKVPWYEKPNLRRLYFVLFPTCLGVEMTSGFDSSMMNGLQAVGTWNNFYKHPRSTMLGLMSALYSLGAVAALPFTPTISDRLGRRRSIVFGSVFMLIGAILQTASQNFAMFVISRFVLGFGIPFAIVAASSLVNELSHPKERAIISSLFNSCWSIGAIVAAGVTLGTFAMQTNWGWRIPSVLQTIPSILQIVFMYFLPESPRWLVSKGRSAEALAILTKYHAEGDVHSEFVKAEFAEIEKTLELEMEVAKRSWLEMVATSGMRRRVLVASFLGLATQWSGNGLTSYFLAQILNNVGITDNRTKNLINLGQTAWSFVNSTLIALTMPRFKRRVSYMICTISLLSIFTGWTIASARYAMTGDKVSSTAVIV
eukprot:PLAT9041.5.p1 GENE.PLAT9041.5~~PLAT9041.5.p1  ORF type:complete len:397 (-),score=-80.73 PLAT9041.5:175-1338(-)